MHACNPYDYITPQAGVDYDDVTYVMLDELRVMSTFYTWCDAQVRLSSRKGYPTNGMFEAFKRHVGLGMMRLQRGYHQVYHVQDAHKFMLARIKYAW